MSAHVTPAMQIFTLLSLRAAQISWLLSSSWLSMNPQMKIEKPWKTQYDITWYDIEKLSLRDTGIWWYMVCHEEHKA